MPTPTGTGQQFQVYGPTGTDAVDGILGGSKWGAGFGSAVQLSYSFPTDGTLFAAGYHDGEPAGFVAFGAAEQSLVRTVLAMIESFINVDFVEVADTASDVGDIRFAFTSTLATNEEAHAYEPGGVFNTSTGLGNTDPESGDVWVDSAKAGSFDTAPGSDDYWLVVHEVLHSLGLKHPFEADSNPYGTFPTSTARDSLDFTNMAFDPIPGSGTANLNYYPTTLMVDDIRALQYLYGANTSHATGDNSYVFNQGSGYNMVLWDMGGTDTIVWNASSQAGTIDLRQGSWQSLGNALSATSDARTTAQTVYIPTGVVIENATGGSANDVLIGNAFSNTLNGGNGNDRLNGLGGEDTLAGGAGVDTAVYGINRGSAVVTYTASGVSVNDTLAIDSLRGIERLEFADCIVRVGQDGHGDFNNNGRDDLVWRHTQGDVVIWEMQGSGRISGVYKGAINNGWQIIDTGGDYNGDGRGDMLWRSSGTGETLIWEMNGPTAQNSFSAGSIGNEWDIFGSNGDYNGDGRSDILWRNTSTGAVEVWQMAASGAKSTFSAGSLATSWQILEASADFNGDGRSDVLWRDSNGDVRTWQMGASGTKSSFTLGNLNSDWQVIEAQGDYNGDGRSDVLWRNTDSGDVVVWEMIGGTAKNGFVLGSATSDWQIVEASGDYNGDGKSDLLWRNSAGDVVTWQMDGAGAKTAALIGNVNSGWYVADAAADYNADNTSDVLWRNSNGTVATWEMHSATTFDSFVVGGVSNDWVFMG
jgi:hypothetical protein